MHTTYSPEQITATIKNDPLAHGHLLTGAPKLAEARALRLLNEAHAEVILGEDAPTSGDCDTCGASHVFDTLADAEEWEETHREIGHAARIDTI